MIDDGGKILLHRRRDDRMWSVPGGVQEIGESIGACVVREVKEKTGLEVVPEYVIGVYSNPHHVHVFDDGMQFTVLADSSAGGR
ncbi:MAG: NUDIX hydrolase [Egibacteraceae bacterium]